MLRETNFVEDNGRHDFHFILTFVICYFYVWVACILY